MIEFTIKPPPPSLNVMLNMHYRVRTKLKKKIRQEIWGQLIQWDSKTATRHRGIPIEKAIIYATRFSIKQLDGFENYPASLKWVVDAITTKHNGLGIIQDDDDYHLITGLLVQVKVKHRKEQRLEVRIVDVGEEPDPETATLEMVHWLKSKPL